MRVVHSVLDGGDLACAWDRFVEGHPLGWVTHLTAWKRILENSFRNIRAHFAILTDNASGEIAGGIPVYVSESWIKGKRLVSIPLATLSDPLVPATDGAGLLWNCLRQLQAETSSAYIEIRTCGCDPAVFRDLASDPVCDYKSHSLSLDSDLDSIFGRFHRTSIRHSIQRGEKAGLQAIESLDVDRFFGLYHHTRKRLGLPTLPKRFFEEIIRNLGESGRAGIVAATFNGEWVAAVLLLKWKARVSADALGWTEKFERLSPGCFVFWHAIRLAHERGYKIFDFGRTHKLNTGLMDHKRRWGTSVNDLPIYYVAKPAGAVINRGESAVGSSRILRNIVRYGPDPIAHLLGRLWYNHLA
jgi:hypothetical protein